MDTSLRHCANVKSRKHPDVSCSAVATHGDFCARHHKNPVRFLGRHAASGSSSPRPSTRAEHQAARRIQKFWRLRAALRRLFQQGPAAHDKGLAANTTEVYSMEALSKIPPMFFFSFADSKKTIWAFDIRSLSHILTRSSTEALNPYTREPLATQTLAKLQRRIQWLRQRKYPIFYTSGETLTPNQLWDQRVLEAFLRLDALGYRATCSWFEELDEQSHAEFYRNLYVLWNIRLGLSEPEKEAIVPRYSSREHRLFKWLPEEARSAGWKLKTWRKHNLHLIEDLLNRATEKTQQSLGALYVIMGLTCVCEEAAEAYPWIAETLSDI